MKYAMTYGVYGNHKRDVYDCVHEFENRESAERWLRGQAIRLYERTVIEGKEYYFMPDYNFYYNGRLEKYEKQGIEITDKIKRRIEQEALESFYNRQVLAYVYATCWTENTPYYGEDKE